MPAAGGVMTSLRALIADDEPLARQALRRFLSQHPDVVVVDDVEDVPALRHVLKSTPADLLFLDITMPGGSGLDVLPELPAGLSLIFTTAHAEHAAQAYAVDAVDYLVKPFGADRVREALARVRRRRAALASTPAPPTLLVRRGARLHPVPLDLVWRFEGADDFVRVVTAERTWLHGTTLGALETQLDAERFVRVHRSHIIQLAHVQRFDPDGERQLLAVFPDGSSAPCSRAGAARVRQKARSLAR
jgi:two-component system, LytTR family, response regulator